MRNIIKLAICAALLYTGVWLSNALGQTGQPSNQQVAGGAINRATVNASVTITTGNTFQTVLASVIGSSTTPRQSLTIENNNASDSCWLFIGSGTPTKAISILLLPGGSYTRYWPYVPPDLIQGTCASNSDTLYVDYQ